MKESRQKIRTNQEIDQLYGEMNIVGDLKRSILSLAGHVWRVRRPHCVGYKMKAGHNSGVIGLLKA